MPRKLVHLFSMLFSGVSLHVFAQAADPLLAREYSKLFTAASKMADVSRSCWLLGLVLAAFD